MLIVLKRDVNRKQLNEFLNKMRLEYELKFKLVEGNGRKLLILLEGGSKKLSVGLLKGFGLIDCIRGYDNIVKLVDRTPERQDTQVKIDSQFIGEGNFSIISGPCSVENEDQLCFIASKLKSMGVKFLRGGAFKPRTFPYSFQGLGKEGVELLLKIKRLTGLYIVTELVDLKYLDLFSDVDVIQIGARNMQNFEMLKQLGRCNKPILLKRGVASTINEWLMSAEYLLSGGNSNVILCERGIRTFETFTRNTLDISSIPVVKRISHLPVVVDPSHAAGVRWLVEPLSKAAVVAGADGLMVEVHNNPSVALSDGDQSLNLDEFSNLLKSVEPLLRLCKKRCSCFSE